MTFSLARSIRNLSVFLFFVFFSFDVFAQTIATSAISGSPFCAGASVNVPYTKTGSFVGGNIFTAQLSDASGNFTSPVNIGFLAATTNGTIPAQLPYTLAAGTAYRIRVVSSNPIVTGTDNGSNLTIRAVALNSPTFAGTTFCQGGPSFNVTYSFPNGCAFQSGNVFTVQLSDAFGGFSAPTSIGSVTATAAGSIPVTILTSTPAGNAYRIRVVGSTPSVISADNGTPLTINALGISAPTISLSSFCQGQIFSMSYTIQNSCNFPNTPASNVFTAQLSDASGSFTSPVSIGTTTSNTSGTINVMIPAATPAGAGYRIRVVSSNPGTGVIGPDNGTNLNIAASSGTPSVFGNGVWNAYVYNSNNFTNYSGFYTENNLSFNTTTRFGTTTAPSSADASTGLAYSGCTVNAAPWSISFKRTNFTCGYYQIDLPAHDDKVTVLINGSSVFSATCCTSNLTNVWTGFLGPTSTVELQITNTGGPGNLSVSFSNPNPLSVGPTVSICSGASTTLMASSTSSASLTYQWNPGALSGASVSVTPTSSTTYTVTATDAITGCSLTGSTLVNVSSTFTTSLTSMATTICSGITTSALTASGANTYTWSPSTGLSATTGYSVVANPTTTTTYTVTGSNGCATNTASVTINAQTPPSSPTASTFGNGTWNVYCHYNNTTLSNYYGYYTENNLSFNTTSRWNSNSGPSVANGSSGIAYTGCSFLAPTASTNYSMSFKRTNFTCGYYQIDIPYHDDNVTLFIDGNQVFQHNGCCDAHTNTWTGFIGPTTTVEFQLINNSGPGSLQISITPSSSRPQTLNTNSVVCAGTTANLSASSSITGATYSWSISPLDATMAFSPTNTGTNPNVTTTSSTPGGNYTITNVLTDAAGTGCTASTTTLLTVNPLPNTTVSPTAVSTYCPSAGIALSASGANSYTWSPSTGLSATTGFTVTATPTSTTTYTVVGSNNCSSNSATTTITVNPLPSITTFPSGNWNVYGFNSTTVGTNYAGYYTENGSGTSGYDFNTTTRWASGAAPSTANATNGTSWLGCTMNATNMSLSFKRSNFACGVYQINILTHDDGFTLLINGTQVAAHNGCCDTHTAIWTGVLNPSSTVEWQLVQGAGGSGLSVQFVPISQTAAIWSGANSTDWFTASNWCTSVPSSTSDAIIYSAGPQNMPIIAASGAQVKSISINGAIAITAYSSAIAAASLTTSSTNSLDVYGNWTNNGTYNSNSGTVSFLGTGSGNTISNSSATTFFNMVLNKTNGITNSSGILQISNNLSLATGVLTQNNSLKILNGATVTGTSNSSYVNGTVTKVGNAAFIFPVGAGGYYRPISISAPSVATDNFTAQYFYTSPNSLYPLASIVASLNHVSGGEYWILNRSGGSSNVSVTLSWDTNSGGVTSLSALRVARWDVSSAKWQDEGSNGSPTGNLTTGTVTSAAAVTTFSSPNSPFTLGSSNSTNPLPIVLSEFGCSLLPNGKVKVAWTTSSEINNDHFEIERSKDGMNFIKLESTDGAGTSSTVRYYSYIDNTSAPGLWFYRLVQVDFDQQQTSSEYCSVQVPDSSISVLMFPNPATDAVTIECSGVSVIKDVRCINSMDVVMPVTTKISGSTIALDARVLSAGIYFIEIAHSGGVIREKLLIVK